MLLMEHPRRLSTDIDIIAETGTDLDKYLDRASESFPFKAVEEQKRIGKNNIEKRHFKFTYVSKEEYLCVNDYAKFLDMKIEQEKLASLRYMRKVNPEAYAYVIKTDRLLAELQG